VRVSYWCPDQRKGSEEKWEGLKAENTRHLLEKSGGNISVNEGKRGVKK